MRGRVLLGVLRGSGHGASIPVVGQKVVRGSAWGTVPRETVPADAVIAVMHILTGATDRTHRPGGAGLLHRRTATNRRHKFHNRVTNPGSGLHVR